MPGDAAPLGDGGGDASLQETWFVYVGGGDGTISIFVMDPVTGELTPSGAAEGGTNPSYLTWDPSRRFLFAVNEASPGRVVAFAMNRANGALARLNDESSSGNGPAHASVDQFGKWLLVANYAAGADGTVAALPILADGRLGAAADAENLGRDSLPHLIVTSPENQYVFVPCKGRDLVAQFRFDDSAGQLAPNTPASVAFTAGAGPRHLAFHPNARFAYVVGELDSTLTALAFDPDIGTLSAVQTVSTLPASFSGSNTGADVRVHPSGKFVYASNRGHDSIAIFSIDEQGLLALLGHQSTQGSTPRNFHIAPSGAFLLVANQNSDNVVTLAVASDGSLADTGHVVAVNSPAFVGVVAQPQ